jgi:ABC-type dipeptide/oligopeptide/nickel transport system permease component
LGGYVLKRVLFMIPTMIGISIVIFMMVRLLPGDIVSVLAGADVAGDPELIQQAREQLGRQSSTQARPSKTLQHFNTAATKRFVCSWTVAAVAPTVSETPKGRVSIPPT